MPLPHERPENRGVLAYLGQGLPPERVRCEAPGPEVDTWRLGAHPDVVERLWVHLTAELPEDARHLVAGGAAVVEPTTGRILAVALGTQYALLLTGNGLRAALRAGYQTEHEFRTVGRTLDLQASFGPGWVFGRHDPREAAWLAESAADANL